jgi:fibronectin type III domain protein
MRTPRFLPVARTARHAASRRSISWPTKAVVGLCALATVAVPTLTASSPASAGSSLLGGALGASLSSTLSSVEGSLAPVTAPVGSAVSAALPATNALSPAKATQSAAVESPAPSLAPAPSRPAAPAAVTAVQGGTLPDVVVSWKNPAGNIPITGAVVQLNKLVRGALEGVTQVTCGSCTTTTLRNLAFGTTYVARVFTTATSGLGAATLSAPVTLSTSCPVGACVTFDTTRSLSATTGAYSGVLDSLYPKGNDQVDGSALGMSLYRATPSPTGPTTYDWSSFNVATSDGAKTIVDLEGEWNSAFKDNAPLPWANWAAYSIFITDTVKNMLASGHQVTYWEVYNEPGGDNPQAAALFSQETPQLLLQQFLVAYRAIKAADPSAKVAGPDLAFWSDYPGQWGSTYHGFDMATFLNFAAANDIQLGALTWHEIVDNLGPNPESNTLLPADIEDHVAQAHALLAAHPSLGNPQIVIDEYGMPEVQKIPGWDVGYLAALTDAGVSLASRSCWDGDCFTPDLDGLLLSNGSSPSADYYDRLVYASMSGKMVATTSTSDTVSALGSYNAKTGAIVGLVGRGVGCMQNLGMCPLGWTDSKTASPNEVNVTMVVPWSTGTVSVLLTDISGATPTLAASAPSRQGLTESITPDGANKGTITLTIPRFRDGDAYGITVNHAS